MTNVLVLAGGISPEREVSLRSGAAVAKALQNTGHAVTIMDPANAPDMQFDNYDVVFPALHGIGGEDGTIQAALESSGVPFVGSGSDASRLCFNKADYKQVLLQNGLVTPEFGIVSEQDLQSNPLVAAAFVLKPYAGGSSIDTFIVRDPVTADWPTIKAALRRNQTMLLEELIDGTEITIGVAGDRALPVIEIIPPVGEEFNYDNKYNGATRELCPPQHVAESIQLEAQALTLKIHLLTGCRDFSRTDMIINADGSLQVLETNTIPGMTEQSLLPKAAAAGGLTMPQLCQLLVQRAIER